MHRLVEGGDAESFSGAAATLADIEADVASLLANVIKYRKLAEEHRAAQNVMIAKKLMELVIDLERRLAELEALKPTRSAAAS